MITKITVTLRHKGMSVSALSQKIKVHYSLLCSIARGEYKPKQEIREAICETLGVAEDTLFNEYGFAKEAE